MPGVAGAAILVLALACQAPRDDTPPGALLSADTASLGRLLERLARAEGTPLGLRARALADGLPECPSLESHAPEGDLASLLEGVRCARSEGFLERLHHERGENALLLLWQTPAGPRVRADVVLDGWGNTEITLEVPSRAARGPARLLLPGPDAPGPQVLSGRDALLHARVRPHGGLDLAALVPTGGQADRLFRLKSALFSGVVLDGSWETALYVPAAGRTVPFAAAALGFNARAAAVAAMEGFLSDLGATWSITRREAELAGHAGACLDDLRILPEFAPCYVATDRALVIGYDATSIEVALTGGEPTLGPMGGLNIDLARLAEADRLLAEAARVQPPSSAQMPWARMRAVGRSRSGAVLLRFHLEVGRGA